jgi:acetoin utilization deacetylase AcuC-like enzyme
MPLQIVSHPDYDAEFPADHRFPMGKYRALRAALEQRGLFGNGSVHQPQLASAELLSRAHELAYVEQVIGCAVPHAIEREIGFAVGERVARRARLASAGTLLAAELALEYGIACNAAGGSHHARKSQGAGFCTFNDVAVAALALRATGRAERILVVDLDVHQGDGTAEILGGEPGIFTFSMHAERNFPVRKVPSSLDIGLADETADDAYLGRLRDVLPELAARSRPELVFYNAGVDPHRDDRLGRLALSDEGLRHRDQTVIGFFRERSVPVCGVIGGGYSRDVTELAERHAILFEAAARWC